MGTSHSVEKSSVSPTKPVPRTPKERIERLIKNKVLEAWGHSDALLWLQSCGLSNTKLSELFVTYRIDGECFLELDEKLFTSHLSPESLANFQKEYHTLQAVAKEYLNALSSAPEKNPDFPPYDLPADSPSILRFYHDASRNTATGGARATRRDWATQPRVCSRFVGAPFLQLNPKADFEFHRQKWTALFLDESVLEEIVFDGIPIPAPRPPIDSQSIAALFFYSFAISGLKDPMGVLVQPRSAFSKRVNASSGGLHPIDAYLLCGNASDAQLSVAGVYHYCVKYHGLEMRKKLDSAMWQQLRSSLRNVPHSQPVIFIALTTRNWREIWKYGERGFRYCQLDVGHAIGALSTSAALLQWHCRPLWGISDESLAKMVGCVPTEEMVKEEVESPAILFALSPSPFEHSGPLFLENASTISNLIYQDGKEWFGKASTLSFRHLSWQVISAAEKASEKKEAESIDRYNAELQKLQKPKQMLIGRELVPQKCHQIEATKVIRSRRSALTFDPKQPITSPMFVLLLSLISRDRNAVGFRAIPNCESLITHIGIYVFNVSGIEPGYYMLLQGETKPLDTWTKVNLFGFPVYLIRSEKAEVVSAAAAKSSCAQRIAESGGCTFAFIGSIANAIQKYGNHGYRWAHWEAGAIGQYLYNQAESCGLRATGLGCFVDSLSLNDFFGETSPLVNDLQVFYHFTVGTPIEDGRLKPYSYEKEIYAIDIDA